MACEVCPFDRGSAVSWARRDASDICLISFSILPQLPSITVATSTATSSQEQSRAAGGARAVSEAIDRISLLGSRYLSRQLQNKNSNP